MKFKSENGWVRFIMRAGQSFVTNKMPVDNAADIVSKGKTEKSSLFDGYEIGVDDHYFFAGEFDEEAEKKGTATKKKN